jgi:molecular chaperone GrpE
MTSQNPQGSADTVEPADAGKPAATADSVDPQAARPDPAARIAELEIELEAALRESTEAREQALRARAESDNVRKRVERDLQNTRKYALERFVEELLPVLDSLELGLAAAGDGADAAQLREGSEITLRMFCGAVEKFGVREVDPSDQGFNPELHQAMSTREVPGVEAGTVVEVVQKGYLLNDRLVRPALVIVAR